MDSKGLQIMGHVETLNAKVVSKNSRLILNGVKSKYFKTLGIIIYSYYKEYRNENTQTSESFFVFEIIWNNLGDPLGFVFEVAWENLWDSLRIIFEVVWKNLRDF